MTLEAWTLHILMKRFLRRKCRFIKNKRVSEGRENDAAKTLAFCTFWEKKNMLHDFRSIPFFLACLNFAIFTAIFIIPVRHLSFDKSEVNSSIYGLCGVELKSFQCLRSRRRSKPTNFQNYSSASGDIRDKEKE